MKKRGFKSILSLLMVLVTMLSFTVTASAADGKVTFQDGKIVVFESGGTYTDSDLFGNFSGVMPGDTKTAEIAIENNANDCNYVKVYMKAVLHDESGNPVSDKVLAELQADERNTTGSDLEYMYDFLSQLSLKVWNETDSSVIYEASPDQLDGLTDNVYLGSIRKGETINLKAELSVPIDLADEYSERIGEVDWLFSFDAVESTKLTVCKQWMNDEEANRPDSVTVQLLCDGEASDEVTLNEENKWTYTWDGLDEDHKWDAKETNVPEGYEVSYVREDDVVTITNTAIILDPVPPTPSTTELTVVKKWDDNGKERPDSVKVTLYNGDKAVDSVKLGDWNDWTYTWTDLDGEGKWKAVESNVPTGYTPSYSCKGDTVTVTNTGILIQTGQMNWPIPVLGGLGLLLIAYGIYVTAKKRKDERA